MRRERRAGSEVDADFGKPTASGRSGPLGSPEPELPGMAKLRAAKRKEEERRAKMTPAQARERRLKRLRRIRQRMHYQTVRGCLRELKSAVLEARDPIGEASTRISEVASDAVARLDAVAEAVMDADVDERRRAGEEGTLVWEARLATVAARYADTIDLLTVAVEGSPRMLPSGGWGVAVTARPGLRASLPGRPVEVTSKKGKTWSTIIVRVVSRLGVAQGNHVYLVETEARVPSARGAIKSPWLGSDPAQDLDRSRGIRSWVSSQPNVQECARSAAAQLRGLAVATVRKVFLEAPVECSSCDLLIGQSVRESTRREVAEWWTNPHGPSSPDGAYLRDAWELLCVGCARDRWLADLKRPVVLY